MKTTGSLYQQAPLLDYKEKIKEGTFMSKVLIVGGGAAGMMAGVHAARNGHEVHILEE